MDKSKNSGVVLLVEDDDIVIDVSRSMIERIGYQVLEARTGQEALNMVNTHDGPVDLVMLDMEMPDMKGSEIFPHIIKARPAAVIVICSGQLPDSDARNMMNNGAHDFLQKPYSYKRLQGMLVKNLERRSDPRSTLQDMAESPKCKVIDISKGGFAFTCDDTVTDQDALIDVAVLLADQGLDLNEVECRIVSEKKLESESEDIVSHKKRKSVSFGKMTKKQLNALNDLIKMCSGEK